MSTLNFTPFADIETASDSYAQRFSGETGKFFLDSQNKIVLNLLLNESVNNVLDVGGGHGQLIQPLLNAGYDLSVLGSSKISRQRLDRLIDRNCYKFNIGNFLKFPYDDNSFDAVVCFRLLPHIGQWQKLIRELCRVSRNLVILDYPDIRSFNILYKVLYNLKKSIEKNTRTFQSFSRHQLRDAFRKHGFYSIEFIPEFFVPMVLHRVINKINVSRYAESLSAKLKLTNYLGSPVIVKGKKSTSNNYMN